MDSLELYHTLHRKPFQPFRVFVRDGRIYDIRHPRLSVVGKTYFAIGIPLAGQPDPPFYVDHADFIDLTWIDRIEMLDGRGRSDAILMQVERYVVIALLHISRLEPIQ